MTKREKVYDVVVVLVLWVIYLFIGILFIDKWKVISWEVNKRENKTEKG